MNSEKSLRRYISKGINIFLENQYDKIVLNLLEETKLRKEIRQLILESKIDNLVLTEAAEDPEVDVHSNTGINTLKDLMKNTNILSTLRGVYKTLTTDDNQRKSFRAHIVSWVEDTLAPITLNDKASLENAESLSERRNPLADGDVDLEITDIDREKLIDADDGSEESFPGIEQEQEPEDGKDRTSDMKPLGDEDTTGRNKAERVYPSVEKSIINYYGELDDDKDQDLFYDYLVANLKLYFDKWENEMTPTIDEPESDAYNQSAESQEQNTSPVPQF